MLRLLDIYCYNSNIFLKINNYICFTILFHLCFRYSTIFKDCVCMIERPRIYSEISMLYSTLGMIFLPLYFKRKAAQAANDLNFPIQVMLKIACFLK